jgi:hypothetical protein
LAGCCRAFLTDLLGVAAGDDLEELVVVPDLEQPVVQMDVDDFAGPVLADR